MRLSDRSTTVLRARDGNAQLKAIYLSYLYDLMFNSLSILRTGRTRSLSARQEPVFHPLLRRNRDCKPSRLRLHQHPAQIQRHRIGAGRRSLQVHATRPLNFPRLDTKKNQSSFSH